MEWRLVEGGRFYERVVEMGWRISLIFLVHFASAPDAAPPPSARYQGADSSGGWT